MGCHTMPHQLQVPIAHRIEPLAYSPNDAAIASSRSRSRIFLALKNGELRARRDGGRTIIEADELQRWIRSFPPVEIGSDNEQRGEHSAA